MRQPKLFVNHNDFLITNKDNISFENVDIQQVDSVNRIFGYCITDKEHFQNENLSEGAINYIEKNNIDISGIFCAVRLSDQSITLSLDPLCQFNLFYFSCESFFIISSNIDMMRKLHKFDINPNYIFDQLAYKSIMRGQTILKNIYYLQLQDVNSEENSQSILNVLEDFSIYINRPEYSKYDNLNYYDLLRLYRKRLDDRAEIVANKFDEIHIQLTGGADSRLALSSFAKFDHIKCSVYGDGTSQNRLVFEEIVSSLDIQVANPERFIGQPLNNSSRVIGALARSSYMKLNNLTFYMNGLPHDTLKLCKITGYYGANIAGGVDLPYQSNIRNTRLESVPKDRFTYFKYVSDFVNKHKNLRPVALLDLFYINNRGKSHYAAHSLLDNIYASSVDILYDYINILLVRKAPYSDGDINKNAISVDLIYLQNPQLAMFPYDSRKIPEYRLFENIPLINCFKGYMFAHKNLKSFPVLRPSPNNDDKNFIRLTNEQGSEVCDVRLFTNDLIRERASHYPELKHLTKEYDIYSRIFLYYLLSEIQVLDLC
ncbi:hypothetical protein [Moraxella sp. RCAD0137]|uniref:hypothetical protein n=1 Tax=Moraxella sp. RCAD0137 TaxID=1775913 RepID=UPI000C9F9927|nr:hypothetical protein [Moraxella sp. RCAD0137]PNP97628.1 hypothetical protein AZ602_06335 [Moraxella sp. RCAD0137]